MFALKEEIEVLKKETALVQHKYDSCLIERSSLVNDLKEAGAYIDTLVNDLEQLISENDALRSEIQQRIVDEKISQDTVLATVYRKLDEANKAEFELNSEILTMRENLSFKSDYLTRILDENQVIKAHLTEIRQKHAEIKEDSGRRNFEVEQLNLHVKNLTEAHEKLNADFCTVQREKNALTAELSRVCQCQGAKFDEINEKYVKFLRIVAEFRAGLEFEPGPFVKSSNFLKSHGDVFQTVANDAENKPNDLSDGECSLSEQPHDGRRSNNADWKMHAENFQRLLNESNAENARLNDRLENLHKKLRAKNKRDKLSTKKLYGRKSSRHNSHKKRHAEDDLKTNCTTDDDWNEFYGSTPPSSGSTPPLDECHMHKRQRRIYQAPSSSASQSTSSCSSNPSPIFIANGTAMRSKVCKSKKTAAAEPSNPIDHSTLAATPLNSPEVAVARFGKWSAPLNCETHGFLDGSDRPSRVEPSNCTIHCSLDGSDRSSRVEPSNHAGCSSPLAPTPQNGDQTSMCNVASLGHSGDGRKLVKFSLTTKRRPLIVRSASHSSSDDKKILDPNL